MIYFIRHGETDYNLKCRLQGQLDIPLNATGISQAEKARDELSKTHFDVIYSSPLSRASKTAEIINEKHRVKLILDERIKEVFGGPLEGECMKGWTKAKLDKVHGDPESFGAESIASLCFRVEHFYKEIEDTNQDILIVAHDGVYRAIYRYINKIEDYDFDLETLPNATVIKLK